jgi:hypothetical protein
MPRWSLFLLVVLVGALAMVTSPDRNPARAEPAQAADAGEVWTLVFEIATKPEGEVHNLTPDGRSTIRTIHSLTAVKDVVIGADGTFKFEGCDFGFCHGDMVTKTARGDMHIVDNLQPLVRGSGKWHPAAGGADESLTLRLEYAAGNGTQTTTAPWYKGTKVETWTISPDGKTLTTTASQGPAASRSRPVEWFVSEWTLRPADDEPAIGKGSATGHQLKVLPVSFAAGDECQDEKPLQAKGRCVACANAPGVGKVKATKKKKEADLGVSISGPKSWHEPPGSSGHFEVTVTNQGPCDAVGELRIYLEVVPDVGGQEMPVGASLSVNSRGPKQSGQSSYGMSTVVLDYFLELAKGDSQVVQVKGHDTTPPNQRYSYSLDFGAFIEASIHDPNSSNNFDERYIYVDLPLGASGSATRPKR